MTDAIKLRQRVYSS